MSGNSSFMAAVKDMIGKEKFGILCSYMGDQPYSNIMAFIPHDDYRSLIFATARSTRKYANLKKHSRASMFIDNRSSKNTLEAKGLSACGKTRELEPAEKKKIIKTFLKLHPALEEFIKSPTVALFKLKVDTYYFVENFQEVTEIHIDP
jgi:general stress protein 26